MRAVIFCCRVVAKKGAPMVLNPNANFSNWKKRYERHRISGIVTYANGRFIHFLEGNDLNIRNALYTAFLDPSYNHFDYCLNVPTHTRTFSDFRTFFPSQLKKSRAFEYFVNTYRASIKASRGSYRALSVLPEKYKTGVLVN